MFDNYKAKKTDFEAVREVLKIVHKKEFKLIFPALDSILRTTLITFDSEFIFLITRRILDKIKDKNRFTDDYFLYKIPHKINFENCDYAGWAAGVPEKSKPSLQKSFLNEDFLKFPKIGGSLLVPFMLSHEEVTNTDPYSTRESYLATIIHEFGHIYWHQKKLSWFSDKKKNLEYLSSALSQKNLSEIKLPVSFAIGEVYAFCCEYYSSQIFWPKHKKKLDEFIAVRIKSLIKVEKHTDLNKQSSVLEPSSNPHDFSFVVGKILMTQHPTEWQNILLDPPRTLF